jgi:hypothetical protein
MNDGHELIDSYLDDELTSDEEARLADWLSADRDNMRAFVRSAHLHRQLRSIMLAHPFHAGADAVVKKAERTTLLSSIASTVLALRPAWLPIAACLVLLIGTGVWFFGATMGQPNLVEVHGAGLSILRAGQSIPVVAGMRLQTADVLRAPTNVTAIIGFAPEATRVTLHPGTELTLAEMSRGKHFDLRVGKLEASITRQRPFHPMIISTPQAQARVVGTRFTLAVTTNATRLDVTEGKVKFTRKTDEMAVKVGAGHYAVATANYELAALPFTGAILREWWSGATAPTFQNDPRLWDHPDGSYMAQSLELEPVTTNRVAVRFRGYVHPPITGDYEFWLAGATDARLFMSPNENPADKVPIAVTVDNSRKLDQPRFRGSSSWAPPVPLVAGHRYYIEALLFIEKDEGHLSVAWKHPGASRELLAGEYLSPVKPK